MKLSTPATARASSPGSALNGSTACRVQYSGRAGSPAVMRWRSVSVSCSDLLSNNSPAPPRASCCACGKVLPRASAWASSTSTHGCTASTPSHGGSLSCLSNCAGWPNPEGSMNNRSGRALRSKRPSPIWNGAPFTQHKHPPATSPSAIPSASRVSSAASRPIWPNSLISTAHRSVSGRCSSRCLIRLVLPAPKGPAITWVGMFCNMIEGF